MKYQISIIVLLLFIVAFYLWSFADQDKSLDVVTVEQVNYKISENGSIVLVDVRTDSEFDGSLGHISGAMLVPLAELETRMTELEEFKNTEMIVICRSGSRSGQAMRILRDNGFDAYNMQGGMLAWNKMVITAKIDSTGESYETTFE